LFIKPFEFESFFNKDWKKFIESALFEAHHKAKEALSMGGGEVPKMHFLPGDYTKDQKYFTQFHPEALGHAAKQRYADDLLKMGQHWDVTGKLPEDMDRAEGGFRTIIKKPGRKSAEESGIDRFRVYKHVLSDILTPEEYADLDDEQKKAYDEAPTEKVKDEESGEMVPKKLLKIYTGHSHLAKALSAPAKIISNQHEYEGNTKFKPGIGLNDIKMHDAEGNVIEPDPQHVKDYLASGHGPYDYDLGKVRMVPKELYEKLSDDEIIERMHPKWKSLYAHIAKDPNWTNMRDSLRHGDKKIVREIMSKNKSFKELSNAIDKTKKKMQEEPGHSMAGFEPIKTEKATSFMSDWMRASALGLLGPRLKEGEMVKDPVTGKKVPVHLMPSEEASKYFGGRNFTAGFHAGLSRGSKDGKKAHPGEHINLEIPVIPRMVSWEDQSVSGASLGHEQKKIWVPYLYDAKTIPHIPWNTEQKAIMAHRKNPDLLPGFGDSDKPLTPEEKEKLTAAYEDAINNKNSKGEPTAQASKLKQDSTSIDITNIMNNWDLLTPEQREHVVKNSRSLLQHAKAMHGKFDTASASDKYSHSNYSHGLGYDVNKSSIGSAYLHLNEAHRKAVIDKYSKQMAEEATKGVYGWLYGSKAAGAIMQGGKQGDEQKLSQSALVPQYIKAAMENVTPELIEISKYYLMTWLNDYWVGIDDSSVGLNAVKAPAIIANPEIATKERINKVISLMATLSQGAISNAPPRRARTKFGHQTGATSDIGGDTDITNLTSKEDQQKKYGQWQQDWWTNRLAKHPGEKVGMSWKGNLGEFTLPKIAEGIRQRVKDSLGGAASAEVDKAMAKATKRMQIAIEAAQALTGYYDNEYSLEKNEKGEPKYTEEELEKIVDERVKKELPETLAKQAPELFANMSKDEKEDLETRLREKQQSAGSMYLHHDSEKETPEYIKEFEEAMNEFWSNVATEESAYMPKYDETNKKFIDDTYKIYLPDFWKRGETVNAADIIKKISAVYSAVSPNPGSKMKAVINKNLMANAFDIYKQILLDAHQASGKTDEQMKQELQQAGLGTAHDEPVKAPLQAQPMQQQPQVAAVAANEVDAVLVNLAKYDSAAEFIKLANQILTNADELKQSPNHALIADKIFQALEKWKIRRNEKMIQNSKAGILPDMAETNAVNTAYKKLRDLHQTLA
jgi:hypothetical protein